MKIAITVASGLIGEMAEALLLASTHAQAKKL